MTQAHFTYFPLDTMTPAQRWWWNRKIDLVIFSCVVLRGLQNGLFRLQHRIQRWAYHMPPDPEIPKIFPLWPAGKGYL